MAAFGNTGANAPGSVFAELIRGTFQPGDHLCNGPVTQVRRVHAAAGIADEWRWLVVGATTANDERLYQRIFSQPRVWSAHLCQMDGASAVGHHPKPVCRGCLGRRWLGV